MFRRQPTLKKHGSQFTDHNIAPFRHLRSSCVKLLRPHVEACCARTLRGESEPIARLLSDTKPPGPQAVVGVGNGAVVRLTRSPCSPAARPVRRCIGQVVLKLMGSHKRIYGLRDLGQTMPRSAGSKGTSCREQKGARTPQDDVEVVTRWFRSTGPGSAFCEQSLPILGPSLHTQGVVRRVRANSFSGKCAVGPQQGCRKSHHDTGLPDVFVEPIIMDPCVQVAEHTRRHEITHLCITQVDSR